MSTRPEGFPLGKPIKIAEEHSGPSVYDTPFDSVAEACSTIAEGIRGLGLTVNIIESGKVVQYWWESGKTDADLVKKSTGTGDDGLSAYQIAVNNGFVGTEAQWLLSLKGDTGNDGAAGANGTDGKSAYQIWLDLGNTGTQSDFIASLKGVKGDKGNNGADGANGTSAYSNAVAGGYTGTETQFNSDLSKTSNAIHTNVANEYSTITEKTTFAGADVFLMEDSAAGYAKKKWLFSSLKTALNLLYKPSSYKGAFDEEYVTLTAGNNGTLTLKNSTVTAISTVMDSTITALTIALPDPTPETFNQSILYFEIGSTLPTGISLSAGATIFGTITLASNTKWKLVYDQIRTGPSTYVKTLNFSKV